VQEKVLVPPVPPLPVVVLLLLHAEKNKTERMISAVSIVTFFIPEF
jgi:hypothetical protein